MNRDTPAPRFRQRLHHGVAWAAGSQGATMLIQAGIVVLLAKLGSAAILGRYALAVSIIVPLVLITRLQLRSVVATDVNSEYAFGEYLGLRLVANLAAFGGVLVVIAFVRSGVDDTATVLALMLVKVINSTSDVYLGLLQRADDWRRIAIASVAKAILGLTAFALTWVASGNLPLSLITIAGTDSLVLLGYEMPAVRMMLGRDGLSAKPVFARRKMATLAWAALPMGIVATLVSLILQIPRYFLEGMVGTEALGHWAAVMQVTTATALLLQPAGQASLARLATYDQSNPPAYRKLFAALLAASVALGVACVIGASFLGDIVLALLYRPEYAALQPILVLTMLGAIAAHISSVFGFTLTAARRFRPQLLLYTVITVVSGVTCYLLIPAYGLTGAAYAHILTWFIACCGGAVVLTWHRRSRRADQPGVSKGPTESEEAGSRHAAPSVPK